jgi:hypothetical protein
MSELICCCYYYASDLYARLLRCPGCRDRGYDSWARSCERRACAYEGRPASAQGRLP